MPPLRLIVAAGMRFLPILLVALALRTGEVGFFWMNPAIIAIDLLTLGGLALMMRAEGKRLRDLYLPIHLRDLLWGLLAGLMVIVAWVLALFIGNLIAYLGPPPTSPLLGRIPLWVGLICLIIMPITIALAEEGLYRGYLQQRLTTKLGIIPALITSALIFGIQHIGLTTLDWQAILAKVITTTLVGLLFGALMIWWKRTGPLVCAHWLLDVLFLGVPCLMLSLN